MSSKPQQISQSLQPGGTPLVRKTSSCTVPLPANHIAVKQQMARDVAEEIVGGMPYRDFFNAFMKLEGARLRHVNKGLKAVKDDHFARIPDKGLEKYMYDKLISCIEDTKLLPNFDVVNTANHADDNSRDDRKWRPDLSVYKKTLGGKPVSKLMKFDKLELPIELKPRRCNNPFADPPEGFKAADYQFQPDNGAQNRGQLVAVLTELSARQFRTHAFLVYLDSQEVRFIRNDRCGLVVTEAINYRSKSKVLAEFFLRFNEMSDAERGWDPTVRVATEKMAELAREKLEFHCAKTETYKATLKRPVVVITVPGGKEGKERQVYGWHSFSDPESLTGRGTRGHPVYDPTDDKVYFLKDTWRCEQLEPEYDILEYLNRKEVPHIPRVVTGGDLSGDLHRTRTQDYVGKSWQIGKVGSDGYDGLDRRIQHRLLEDLIDARIWDCSDAQNMMTLVHHAFIAHEAAYTVGYLHRDISDNNVMVAMEDGKPIEGILADWDLALRVKDENGQWITEHNRRQRCRTGTWYFMSSRLLDTPSLSHILLDDLESFFHLVFFLSLCLFETNMPARRQVIFTKVFADSDYDDEQRAYVGGAYKELLITKGKFISKPDLKFTDNDALTSWVHTARLALKSFYDLDPVTSDLAKVTEELSLNDPLYRHKESWDKVLVKDHRAMMEAFEETLLKDGWSKAKPGISPFERSPRYQKKIIIKQSEDDDVSADGSRTSRQSGALASSSSLQVPGPTSRSNGHRRSPRTGSSGQSDVLPANDGLQLPGPASGSSERRRSPRFQAQPE